jgi:capsular exopolysaccharide synthesis family protein
MSRIYEARLKAERGRLIEVDPKGALQQEPYARPSEEVRVDFSKWTDESPQFDPVIDQLMNPEEAWFEQIRTLRERVRLLEKKSKIHSTGIVSATGGEGKTTVATALSLVLARDRGKRILLVDADLRNGKVADCLGIESEGGLANWLQDPTKEVPLRRLEPQRTFVLTAGQRSEEPWELINSPSLEELLIAAKRSFDLVVVDCPPLGIVADTAQIQEYIDSFLLVVRVRCAPREGIRAAVEQLREDKIIGTILNDTRPLTSHYHEPGRYNGYYRKTR